MNDSGTPSSEYTYSTILSVFGEATNLYEGQRIHRQLKVAF